MTIHLRRSSPSIHQLAQIQRLHSRQLSAPPESPSASLPLLSKASNANTDHLKDCIFDSLARWFSGIVVGSSLGLLYWSSNSDSISTKSSLFPVSFLSFADWSMSTLTNDTTDDDDDDRQSSSSSLFRKLSLPDYSSNFLFGEAYRRKIFFNYEKRIRLRSPPEKVFEYFASLRSPEGELLMRPADLMRAIVPVFPPSESHLVRDGYLRGERRPGELRCAPSEFFMLFDMNNDGLISFKEEISKEEFKQVMALMRSHNRQGAFHRDGLRTGLNVKGPVENGGLVEYFFGEDGRARLQHEKFVQFMRNLYEEMLRLEFAHYDYKQRGTISAEDFALSMVASADMGHLNKLLNRVDQLKNERHLCDLRITFEEFKNFAELRRKLQPFCLALFSYGKVNGLLTRDDFQRAAYRVCGILLTDNVIDIIFQVFDSNRDGNLSLEEFVRVLHNRERDIAQPVETGILGFLNCCWNFTNNSSIGKFLC
ncbi:calcium uptake protein [Citrus sinensis]|nr:calcium uptake protein [Citrus sinensis]